MDKNQQQDIAPIRHNMASSVGSTVAGAGGGALGGAGHAFSKTWKFFVIAGAIAGLVWGLSAVGAPVLAAIGLGKGAAAIVSAVGTVAAYSGACALAGVFLGAVGGSIMAAFGGVAGAYKGGKNANERVRQEKGAATVLDAQLQAYEAQAGMAAMQAQTQSPAAYINTGPQETTINPQGSRTNAALSSIAASGAQLDGTIDNNLQVARA